MLLQRHRFEAPPHRFTNVRGSAKAPLLGASFRGSRPIVSQAAYEKTHAKQAYGSRHMECSQL
eukprot:10533945-Alexandrium_andersonii.AAC.1